MPGQRHPLRRADDFISRYANNVQAESSAFDLKLIFGVLDQSAAARGEIGVLPTVEQHTSINISWPLVKLLIFWLRLHLAGYESENGKVRIPAAALPPEVPQIQLPPHLYSPKVQEILDMIRKMRAEFLDVETKP
jgi:hypothetical protein